MFVTFFGELKAAGVPVTLREYLTLMEAMQRDLAGRRVEDFYYLSRAALIKDREAGNKGALDADRQRLQQARAGLREVNLQSQADRTAVRAELAPLRQKVEADPSAAPPIRMAREAT